MNTNNRFNVGDIVKFQSSEGCFPWEGQTFTVKYEIPTEFNTFIVRVESSGGERYLFLARIYI